MMLDTLAAFPRIRFMGSKHRLAPRLAELFAKRAGPGPIAAALARAARRGGLDRASLEAAYGRIVALKDAVAAG